MFPAGCRTFKYGGLKHEYHTKPPLLDMCVSPVLIKNPNLGVKYPAGSVNSFKDCTSAFIPVPCGHCFECISARKFKLVQRSQVQTNFSVCYFATLTYDNEHLPSIEVNGFNIRYADIHDIQLLMKSLRHSLKFNFKYLAVSERGSKGRPHFHVLFYFSKNDLPSFFEQLNFEKELHDLVLSSWRRNVGSRRVPVYENNCRFVQKFKYGRLFSSFDLHLVTPSVQNNGSTEVVYYITKYLLKSIGKGDKLQQALKLNLSPEEYDTIWKLVKDKCVYSKDFGLRSLPEVQSLLRYSIELSKANKDCLFPSFQDLESGNMLPMCRFYKDVSVTYDDMKFFYERSHKNINDVDTIIFDDRSLTEKVNKIVEGDYFADLNEQSSLFDESDILFN